jgi:hypothetical protein
MNNWKECERKQPWLLEILSRNLPDRTQKDDEKKTYQDGVAAEIRKRAPHEHKSETSLLHEPP